VRFVKVVYIGQWMWHWADGFDIGFGSTQKSCPEQEQCKNTSKAPWNLDVCPPLSASRKPRILGHLDMLRS
jgi:hypothetical protein